MTDAKKPDDDGGLAFPTVLYDAKGFPTGQALGMTLRDWFAGQALAGLLASRDTGVMTLHDAPISYTTGAYLAADEMLKERDK